jgi:CheY-like chemotaxis protein
MCSPVVHERGPVRGEPNSAATVNAPQRALQGWRVLVVDDEQAVRSALQTLLSGAGCVVHVAATARAAHEVLRTEPIDLLIVDYLLPDVRGDIVHAIATAYQPHLTHRTVFLTRDATAASTIEAIGCRMVREPFASAALLEVLKEVGARPV